MKIDWRTSLSLVVLVLWLAAFAWELDTYVKSQSDALCIWLGVAWALGFSYYMGRNDKGKSMREQDSDALRLIKMTAAANHSTELHTVRQLTRFTFNFKKRHENEKSENQEAE